MSILSNLFDAVNRAGGRVRAAFGGSMPATAPPPVRSGVPTHGSHRLRQVPTLSEWDAEDVLAALQAHAQGQFRASAQLADYLGQSDAVVGVLDALRRSVVGLPFDVTAPEDSPDAARSTRLALELRRAWPRMMSRGTAAEVVKWCALMGFAICERVWRLDPRTGRWSVKLKPWHPCYCRFDWARGCFVVSTSTGEEDVTPDSSKWCLFTDLEETRPWMSGAVRAIGILALICWWLDRDGSRWSEKHGLPPLGAKVPMAQSEDPRTDRFLSDLEDLGTEPIMRLPQGEKDQASFDIEWKELKNATAWQGFLEPGRDVRSRIATVVLGQPLTTTAGVGGSGSYALGKVHSVVRQDVIESYALLLGTARQHAVMPWMRINETTDTLEAEALAPCPTWDASPPADAKADAETSEARARAIKAWQETGVAVDATKDARDHGVPVSSEVKAQAAPIFAYHITTGVVTIDEVRASLGLDPPPNGAGAKPAVSDAPAAEGAKAAPAAYEHINFTPPQGVADAAQRGLDLYAEGHGGDGLVPSTIAAAHRLAAREEITPERVRTMRGWFARHEVDRAPGWDNPPTPGYVAWMLWGGDPGQTWAEKVVRQMDAADAEES